MSTFPSPANAIVYAQFNIQGQWRRLLSITIGYAVVIGALIWVTYIAGGADLQGWVAGLCMLQMLNLLVFGSFRVDAAVRGDVSSRMLESHRLMPATPLGGMLGYILGAPFQSLLLAVVNFGLGTICCINSNSSPQTWALFNGILLLFSLFVYSMLAQFAFVARGGFLLMLIAGALIFAMAAQNTMGSLPAIAVLIAPFASPSSIFEHLFSNRGRSFEVTGYLVAFAGQIAVILISIRVGIRRYKSSSIAGISQWLGLMMLAVWVGLTMAFFRWNTLFIMHRSFSPELEIASVLWIAFATSSLLALLPIGSAAWTEQQKKRSGDPSASRWRFPLVEVLTTLAAIVLVSGLLLEVPKLFAGRLTSETTTVMVVQNVVSAPVPMVIHHTFAADCVHSVIIVAIFLCSMACLFSWGYLIRQRAWIFVLIWVMLTWLAPIIGDAIYKSLQNDNRRGATVFTAFSPAGALAMIWEESDVSVVPGIIGQLVLALMPTAILLLTQQRYRNRLANKIALAAQATAGA